MEKFFLYIPLRLDGHSPTIFTKIDPLEVLTYYLEACMKDGIDPVVDPFNLPKTYPDVHGKRKKESRG